MFEYQNRNIAIYGMGKTGISAANALIKLKARVSCWDDSQEIRKKVKKLNYKINKFWKKDIFIDSILISPGIDINKCKIKNYLKKNLNKIITDLDIFFELNKKSLIISITGTNGKSTTCKIIEKILKASNYKVKTVGNIGNPILSLSNTKKKNIFILEASSYQLQYSKLFHSNHAAILNISPDHLERHKNIKNYIKTKSKLFFAQNRHDFSYISSTNKYSKFIKDIFKKRKIKSKLILIKKSSCNSLLKKITNKYIKSRGNIENLAFAYNIVKNLKSMKINDKTIIKALNKFTGLSHRQETVISNKKVLCINDSKATSFDASLQALLNYDNIYWIVGGYPKHQDHFKLQDVKKKIIKTYIIGKSTNFFVKNIINKTSYKISKNLNNAVNDIFRDIKLDNRSRSTILLSPAAASFDQFDNFEERGSYFKKLIIKKFKK